MAKKIRVSLTEAQAKAVYSALREAYAAELEISGDDFTEDDLDSAETAIRDALGAAAK